LEAGDFFLLFACAAWISNAWYFYNIHGGCSYDTINKLPTK
jgi:hypothetical protein